MTFSFALPARKRVLVTVDQVSPTCKRVTRFGVVGHRGINRVRLGRRIKGQELQAGTYRVTVHTRTGQVLRRVTLVVVDGRAPSGSELRALGAANTCSAAVEPGTSANGGNSTAAGTLPKQQLPAPLSSSQQDASGLGTPSAPNVDSGVLGSSVEKTVKALRPLLIALLLASIVLFALASMPQVASGPRFSYLLARHRTAIAALGAAALAAVAIAFLIA